MFSPTLVEFLGTSLLIGSMSFAGTPVLMVAAFATALGLGGKISGGHFNPAVTMWALASGKIGQAKAVCYILAQISAAVFIWIVGSMIKL